jgi:hypothetical protein
VNPKGATSARRAKHASGRQGLPGDVNSGTATHRTGPTLLAAEKLLGETVGEFVRAETSGPLPGGERSEGDFPRVLPARNKAGKAAKGASRREGSQTLGAERSGQARPA